MTRVKAAAGVAAFAAIALAGPALAQSAIMAPVRGSNAGPARPAGSFVGTPSRLSRSELAPLPDRRRDRDERPDRPHRRYWRGYAYPFFYGYGGGIDALIPPDLGYFATGGEALRGPGGVYYDYDRGYPYDYYSPRAEHEAARDVIPRERYCETQWTRGRSNERVPVTICRN